MSQRMNNFLLCFRRWLLVLLSLLLFLMVILLRIRPLVFAYAQSNAENRLLRAADKATMEVLDKQNIGYSDISHISRDDKNSITGIEIDVARINQLKSEISDTIKDQIEQKEFYDLRVPVGMLTGIDSLTGVGPILHFKMRLSETCMLDYESTFKEAGINQTIHQITIKMNLNGSMLIVGYSKCISVSTSAIAAQTVIVGPIPDSYTSVEEQPGDDVADDIFNFAE